MKYRGVKALTPLADTSSCWFTENQIYTNSELTENFSSLQAKPRIADFDCSAVNTQSNSSQRLLMFDFLINFDFNIYKSHKSPSKINCLKLFSRSKRLKTNFEGIRQAQKRSLPRTDNRTQSAINYSLRFPLDFPCSKGFSWW